MPNTTGTLTASRSMPLGIWSDEAPHRPDGHASFAAELYEWLAERPHVHEQGVMVGPSQHSGTPVPAGLEPPEGITLCTAAAACHLAGFDLRAGSVEAVDPTGRPVYIPAKAAQLLGLTEIQALALFFTPSALTSLGRLAQLIHR